MNKPLLTFCLVAYNQEEYIREAVESALSQTYSPLEIVLSDDCSSDRTFEIMCELAEAYCGPHTIVLNRNPQNMGLAAHASKVWSTLSHGEWLIGAAGDDIYLPNRAEKIAEMASLCPNASCIWSGCTIIDDKGEVVRESRPDSGSLRPGRIPAVLGATVAYRRDVYDFFGPVGHQVRNDDVVMSLRSALLGEFAYIPESLVRYRKHSTNLSGNFTDDRQKVERLRARLGFAYLQQLSDLQLFLERRPEAYRRCGAYFTGIEDNYLITQLFSAWRLYPERRGFLFCRNVISPRVWRIFLSRLFRRLINGKGGR